MPTSKTRRTTQQRITPTEKRTKAVELDNELQTDQKINLVLSLSDNIAADASSFVAEPSPNGVYKTLLLAGEYQVQNFSSSTEMQVYQGSNYPVFTPKNNSSIIVESSSPIIFENLEFYSEQTQAIVSIQSNTKVLFKNCIFRKATNSQTLAAGSCYVAVGSTSKASFVGCWFLNNQTNGSAINNAGAPADVSVNGGYNSTGLPHLNTTSFGELT